MTKERVLELFKGERHDILWNTPFDYECGEWFDGFQEVYDDVILPEPISTKDRHEHFRQLKNDNLIGVMVLDILIEAVDASEDDPVQTAIDTLWKYENVESGHIVWRSDNSPTESVYLRAIELMEWYVDMLKEEFYDEEDSRINKEGQRYENEWREYYSESYT